MAVRRWSLRYTLLSIVCVTAVAGACFSYAPIRRAWDIPFAGPTGPKLERWTTPGLFLGEGQQNEILTGTFRIRNTGSEPLTFRIDGSCTCAELKPKEGEVGPGDVQEITVGVRLREEGRTEKVTYKIATNDPDAAETFFVINANCPAPFTVTPPRIDIGTVVPGSSVPSVTIVVRAGLGKNAPPVPVFVAESKAKGLTVTKADTVAGEQRFTVQFEPGAGCGAVLDEILLRSPGQEVKVRIPFAAEVVGPLSIAPRSVELRRGEGESAGRADVILWRPDGQALGPLDEAACPPGVSVKELTSLGAVRRRFTILVPDGVSLPLESEVRFRFAGIAETASVRIRVAGGTAKPMP